jgi:hypothetical protein
VEIVIATDPERENLIAQVMIEGLVWADVRYDDAGETYEVIVYSTGDEDSFVVDLAEAMEGLAQAKEVLIAHGYPSV